MNVAYDTVYCRDLRFYKNCVTGYLKRRECNMNDMQIIGQRCAAKIAQYVWSSNKASNPLDTIHLIEETAEEKLYKTLIDKGII